MTQNERKAVKDADHIDKKIGMKIQELRIAMGMSRHQLAEKIGVTHQQTQKYEKGINRISAGRLASIAEALQKPVGYFFEDEENNDTVLPSQHQRMCIEVSRNFLKINNPAYREAVNTLIRTLASEDGNLEDNSSSNSNQAYY